MYSSAHNNFIQEEHEKQELTTLIQTYIIKNKDNDKTNFNYNNIIKLIFSKFKKITIH